MPLLRFLLPVLIPALTWAALCDETYYLNAVSQSTFSGSDPKNLSDAKRKSVRPDLSDLDVLDSLVAYNVLVEFQGSCAKAPKQLTFKSKASGKKVFSDAVDMSYNVQMFDTTRQLEGFKYDYWFGFFKPADTLRYALGRYNAESDLFVSWYVAVMYRDSVRNATSGLWSAGQTTFYPLVGPDDSLILAQRMVDQTIGKLTVDENHKGRFMVQYLKVAYDSKPPNGLLPRKRASSDFQASQTGDLVLIRPGAKNLPAGEALSLYGMMGNKVATLHPTGYAYQWNGKTAAGASAPTGVYFVQSGNRILGKFFYSR